MMLPDAPLTHFLPLDWQTKETLTLKPSAFGSKAELDDKFFKKMMAGTTILDSILSFGQDKQAKDMKKTDGKNTTLSICLQY